MNENQRDTEHRPDEGKQVQQELERQLREFGDTMSDAFRHGFEGRGMDIGDRAFDVGKAAVHAANYGINAAGRAVREGQQACQRQAEKKPRGRQAAAARPGPGSSLPGNRSRPLWRTSAPAPKSATMRAWPCWRWASRLQSSLAFRPSAVLVLPPCLPPAPCWGRRCHRGGCDHPGVRGRGRGDWQLCHGRDPGQRLGIHSHHRIVRLDDGSRCFPDACWQKAEPLRRHGRRV